MKNGQKKELLNIKDACQVIGVSRHIFGRLVSEGKIAPACQSSKLYRRSELVRFATGEPAAKQQQFDFPQ